MAIKSLQKKQHTTWVIFFFLLQSFPILVYFITFSSSFPLPSFHILFSAPTHTRTHKHLCFNSSFVFHVFAICIYYLLVDLFAFLYYATALSWTRPLPFHTPLQPFCTLHFIGRSSVMRRPIFHLLLRQPALKNCLLFALQFLCVFWFHLSSNIYTTLHLIHGGFWFCSMK